MASLYPFRLGAALAAVIALAACGDSGPQKSAQKGAQAPQVTVAQPQKRTVMDRDVYVGRFVAIDSVEIRARVSGYLDAVLFTDGELVEEGAPFF
jgi:multidrug efflux pump subunit AcrA (membrane-fusion protein)